jgi:hypothetical protein
MLTRSVGMGDRDLVFIGVNPSTADATVDDATIRKCCGFARRWGFDRMHMVNLCAFRATDVRELGRVQDPIGPDTDRHLREVFAGADLIVPAWGARGKLPVSLDWRIEHVRELLCESEKPCKVLGLTKHGDPRHPLMPAYSTPLEDWRP